MKTPAFSKSLIVSITALTLMVLTFHSANSETVITDQGTTNPVEESIDHQLDKMRVSRNDGTLTVLCWKAHEMDKAGMHREALPVMIRCAEEGHDISMLELAKLYETGSGVKQDLAQAAMWLKKSSDRGFSTGQLYYGIALMTGRGVAQNIERGKALIKKAASQNDAMALKLIETDFDIETVIPDHAEDMSRPLKAF